MRENVLAVVNFKEALLISVSERMNEERGDVRAQKGRTRSSSVAVDKAESCAACRTKLSFSTEPKLLPCLHMMCKGCVINTTEEKNSKGKLHACLHVLDKYFFLINNLQLVYTLKSSTSLFIYV